MTPAPATTAPLLSVTVPRIVPPAPWPYRSALKSTRNSATTRLLSFIDIDFAASSSQRTNSNGLQPTHTVGNAPPETPHWLCEADAHIGAETLSRPTDKPHLFC